MISRLPPDELLWLETERMILEPVRESHADALYELFSDSRLFEFTPYELQTPDEHAERCARWAGRISPQKDELWLNWIALAKESRETVGHFQAGIKDDQVASVAYLVARDRQGQGYASEGMRAMFHLLKEELGVRRARAEIDTRNAASIRLVERLGMKRGDLIKNADFFKGSTSDEWVYELELG